MPPMTSNVTGGGLRAAGRASVLVVVAALAFSRPHDAGAASRFPDIPLWSIVGGWRDSSLVKPNRCVGSFKAPLPESIQAKPRTITVRFLRDRSAEARPDFGGYRIYRMSNSPDSTKALLIRRFSLNTGSELTWNASRVTKTSNISLLINDGTGSFLPRVEVRSGVTPSAIVFADLNRDRKPDLVVANPGSNSVTIAIGNGAGGTIFNNEVAVGLAPSAVAVDTVNRDTLADIVVASADTRELAVLLGGPGGTFEQPRVTLVAAGPSALLVRDLNGDRRPDFLVAGESSDSVAIVLGTPSGDFGAETFLAVGSRPSALAVGDVTGDGVLDLVVANRGGNNVSVFTGLGPANFGGGRVDYPTGDSPAALALSDVNGDGKPDILVANGGSGTVTVLLNNGLGVFAPVADVPTGTNPRGIAVADLNGDGKPDLAVANQGSNTVSILDGDGTGAFPVRAVADAGVGPVGVTAGDFNADGKPDLIVPDFSYRLPYICGGAVVDDSTLTFVDPDSIGQYVKVCRQILNGRCAGDSVFVLIAPPGPHDGFLTWYSITYEKRNTTDPDYEDLFLPDTLDSFARCTNPLDRGTCPNLNHKLRNLTSPIEPTGGPTANLERVLAVPNPYRGHEVWDPPGRGEVHFINLPSVSRIRIYTVAGDLVRELQHNDRIRDFERWDLKNASGNEVASGIYVYRIESGSFHFQNRLVVIR